MSRNYGNHMRHKLLVWRAERIIKRHAAERRPDYGVKLRRRQTAAAIAYVVLGLIGLIIVLDQILVH